MLFDLGFSSASRRGCGGCQERSRKASRKMDRLGGEERQMSAGAMTRFDSYLPPFVFESGGYVLFRERDSRAMVAPDSLLSYDIGFPSC